MLCQSRFNLRNPVFWAIIVSFLYWLYLGQTTIMEISADARVFENLGIMLYEKGWGEYFRTGPQREPGYPLLAAFTMYLSDLMAVPYQIILKHIQIIILLVTQILLAWFLTILQIRKTVLYAILLYWAFSPAVVNSAFSAFSEILTYPFVLGIIFLSCMIWQMFQSRDVSFRKIIVVGSGAAVLSCLLSFSKVIFDYAIYLYIIPFLVMACYALWRRRDIKPLVFLLVWMTLYNIPIYLYKSLNYRHNSYFAMADRGDFIFYGTAKMRTRDLTARQVLAGIAFIPGQGVCEKIMGEKDCYYWTFIYRDSLGISRLTAPQNEKKSWGEVSKIVMQESKEAIFRKPWQYAFFTFLEGMKMFFWESTQIGFVTYPPWLTQLYASSFVRFGIRLVVSLLTIAAFLHALFYLWGSRRRLGSQDDQRPTAVFITAIFVIALILFYSLTTVVPRYAFPIVPLYMILIALFFDKI